MQNASVKGSVTSVTVHCLKETTFSVHGSTLKVSHLTKRPCLKSIFYWLCTYMYLYVPLCTHMYLSFNKVFCISSSVTQSFFFSPFRKIFSSFFKSFSSVFKTFSALLNILFSLFKSRMLVPLASSSGSKELYNKYTIKKNKNKLNVFFRHTQHTCMNVEQYFMLLKLTPT